MASMRKCLIGFALVIAVGIAALGVLAIILSLREAGHVLPIADVLDVLLYRDLTHTASRCAMFSYGMAGMIYGAAIGIAVSQQRVAGRVLSTWAFALIVLGTAFIGLGMKVGSLYPGP